MASAKRARHGCHAMETILKAAETPQVNASYYIVNAAHQKLLDTHGPSAKTGPVWVWNNSGRSVLEAIAQNMSERRNVRWKMLACPHESNSVYFVNEGHAAFLDTHGRGVKVWNNGGKDVATVIKGNISESAGNLRWKVVPCPHQQGAFYIVNTRHASFLDTHGKDVWVWNSGGRTETSIIGGNTTDNAGNVRWVFIDADKQDRFGSELGLFGLRGERTDAWVKMCKAAPTVLDNQYQEIIRQQRRADDRDEYTPIFRAYTLPSDLYSAVNGALLENICSLMASPAIS